MIQNCAWFVVGALFGAVAIILYACLAAGDDDRPVIHNDWTDIGE